MNSSIASAKPNTIRDCLRHSTGKPPRGANAPGCFEQCQGHQHNRYCQRRHALD